MSSSSHHCLSLEFVKVSIRIGHVLFELVEFGLGRYLKRKTANWLMSACMQRKCKRHLVDMGDL